MSSLNHPHLNQMGKSTNDEIMYDVRFEAVKPVTMKSINLWKCHLVQQSSLTFHRAHG
jgi:hypothetical protein